MPDDLWPDADWAHYDEVDVHHTLDRQYVVPAPGSDWIRRLYTKETMNHYVVFIRTKHGRGFAVVTAVNSEQAADAAGKGLVNPEILEVRKLYPSNQYADIVFRHMNYAGHEVDG